MSDLKINVNYYNVYYYYYQLPIACYKTLWHSKKAKYFLSEQDKADTPLSFQIQIKATKNKE